MFRSVCLAISLLFTSVFLPVTAGDDAGDPWFSEKKVSENGVFEVTLEAGKGTAELNSYHDWLLTVRDARSKDPVATLRVNVGGGMAHHGHGLPSQPQVGKHLGDGRYEVKGVKFNMNGKWTLAFDIDAKTASDKVVFDVMVDY